MSLPDIRGSNGVIDFMKNHRAVYYCHEHGLPR